MKSFSVGNEACEVDVLHVFVRNFFIIMLNLKNIQVTFKSYLYCRFIKSFILQNQK